ncbi:hypothetical protein QJS66_15535 [Kocuria rhizophila]|nr:hypothetical protein QJS66_15535 [Kocuria rhizophila]
MSLPSVARAATLGVQVYPSVASADFAITGGLDDLHLTVTLAFTPSMENQRIKDEITTELIPGLEAILGASFAPPGLLGRGTRPRSSPRSPRPDFPA